MPSKMQAIFMNIPMSSQALELIGGEALNE
jgi:hypothetical protein